MMCDTRQSELALWLEETAKRGASDLHLSHGIPPTLRIHGRLHRLSSRPLDAEACQLVAKSIMSDTQWGRFLQQGELDFSYSVSGLGRYRVNVFQQRSFVSVAIRVVPITLPPWSSLGLPPQIEDFTNRSHGLLLVTGPTGSGKSTTLASLVDAINHRDERHIVTLEDPIEYLHVNDRSLVHQREVGVDTVSFQQGLRAALRQDPDVIVIGEIRDLDTIQTALTAAETGHLVLTTLHSPDAVHCIERIVDVFPSNQQPQVRVQLASVLIGVVSQRLVPSADGQGRVVVCEVLVNTSAVANLIRSEQIQQIKSCMQTGKQYGMQTFEMHVHELTTSGQVKDVDIKHWASDC